jgi:hypothetical protein
MRAPDTLPPEVELDLEAMDAAVAGRSHPHGGDTLLAELAALVTESRPELAPDRARLLDQRAAAGFVRPRRRVTLAWRRSLAPAAGLAACAAIALAVVLATGGGGSVPGRDSAGSAGAGSAAAPVTAEGARGSVPPVGPAPGGDPRSDSRTARKVERNATMTLGAPRGDLDAVAGDVARTATMLGGFVASSSISSTSGGDLELRIPSARLDDAVARLGRIAHVRRLERSTLDITAQSVSARTRVRDLEAERRSLARQLAAATSLTEIDRLKARLRDVTARLDAARTQAARIDNRAAYATLSVALVPERQAAAAGGGWSPGDAWHDALSVLEFAAGVALIALAVAVPLALLWAPAWLARRRLIRQRRERALDMA